ncbi:metal ABC transporter permease [Nocardioides yefusunii]|uniref:Metal ABC transporter permease n=1 Tax=Nocardioides yefusunii TaxID=2500546 RepID=A0ABW1QVW9_9ACTN|nr:metal ABC transporter permease [Nocardioides yefusunii]
MNDYLDLLSMEFMVRALLAAFFTGLAVPAVGTYMVQRRMSLMGDGLGHVAVTGVAIGLVTSASPTWTAVVAAILGAVAIELIRERGLSGGDVALALLFYGGLAGGIFVAGLGGQSTSKLQQYLFGSITTISWGDVLVTVILAAVLLVLCVGLAPQLFAVAHDQEFARVSGLNTRFYNLLVAILAAISVTVAMRTVGLLLVSALMVIPVATAQQVTSSFRRTLWMSMTVGMTAAVGGLLTAAGAPSSADVAPGASIVLVALAIFLVAWPFGAWMRRRDRLNAPFPLLDEAPDAVPHTDPDDTGHTHLHGEDCGHRAVPHGDHVDYLHDGHRHAPHGEHYDEH